MSDSVKIQEIYELIKSEADEHEKIGNYTTSMALLAIAIRIKGQYLEGY